MNEFYRNGRLIDLNRAAMSARRGHRAIVVYDPSRERRGNWVPTVMGQRYDALLSFGETSALHPL